MSLFLSLQPPWFFCKWLKTVGFARRSDWRVHPSLTRIKIISAFSAEIEPKGVRVLPTSCGRRTAGHDACYFDKEAENAVIFTCENVLQSYCCKQLLISPRYRQKRLKFRFYMVDGVLPRYADISRRNRRYYRCVEPESSDGSFINSDSNFLNIFLPSL